jgi:hypothetical protein
MKLLYCNHCKDTLSLSYTTKTCHCGETGGHYEADGLNAKYYGNATPLGFTNDTFNFAKQRQPQFGAGFEFTAFVIPKVCPTMVHIDFLEYIPVTDGSYDDGYEYLEEDVAKIKAEKKLGNAFKQTDSDAI